MKSKQEIERLARRKRKNRLTLILLCVMAVSVTAAILLAALLPENNGGGGEKVTPEIIEGEALHNNYAIAYPSMQEGQIKRITINNKNGEYTLSRTEESDGNFVLFYVDKNGEDQIYYPDIVLADSSFDYESLYSIEQNDGYNRIYKLSYLCSALEYPYFNERIALPQDDEEELKFQLRRFGLDEPQTIRFDYTDDNGKTVTHKIKIGTKNPTELGYYFMVDDRPYVYNATSNYYDYALLGFASYINSALVSKGLSEDSAYEPYLTTDFKHWVNETYKKEGTEVNDNSTVIINANVFSPLETALNEKKNGENADGYEESGYKSLEFDLSYYKNKAAYKSLVKAVSEAKIGVLYSQSENIGSPAEQIIVTLPASSKPLDFSEKSTLKYEYTVLAVEAILTDGNDVVGEGTVAENDKIKIAYTLKVNGKKMTFAKKEGDKEAPSDIIYHAVIDLSEKNLPEGAADLVGKSVGKLSEPLALTVDYTEKNSVPLNAKYKITEIISIYNKNGVSVSKITETSQIVYRYCLVIDGVEQEETYTSAINLAKDDSENAKAIKKKLVGRGIDSNLNIIAYEYTLYCEYMKAFRTYEISQIKAFITSDMISSFNFVNSSERDPFYGESIYENTLDNKYGIYGLNSSACEAVVKMLGGVGETTGVSNGLVGIETVAVGLTPEIKDYYGLYAHTVYFELPRGIIVKEKTAEEWEKENSTGKEIPDDYTHYETLGFTLYVSEEDPVTKTRYVGSDLYDIVVTVSSETFFFLEYDFIDFWARRNLILLDVEYIQTFAVEFNMTDVLGRYLFSLNHTDRYLNGNTAVIAPESYKGETFDYIDISVLNQCKCEGECKCTKNELLAKMEAESTKKYSLKKLYDTVLGAKDDSYVGFVGTDSYATTYFKELLRMLYLTQYEGSLDEQQQKEAFEGKALMRFEIKLRKTTTRYDTPTNASSDTYVYEFYRCGDRRVMVNIYQINGSGNVTTEPASAFYISTPAFKKIVSAFLSILNAEEFDIDESYMS